MISTAAPALPHRVIRPPSKGVSLGLAEVWEFRDLLQTLAARDVKLRYRQTVLGVLWVVLQPLLTAAIFAFVFGKVAGLQAGGVDYFCFAFAGQLAWTAFSQTLVRSSSSLLLNAPLVAKVFFPRLVLPLSTVYSTTIDVGVGLIALGAIMLLKGQPTAWGLVALPVWLLLLAAMGLGIGMAAAAFAVSYRDVGMIVPVVVQLGTYLSPVGWPLAEFSQRYGADRVGLYLLLNPAAALIEACRWSLFGRASVPWGYVLYAAFAALTVLLVGILVFRAQERRFADVI